MWSVDENEITMCEGDYGIDLPISIEGAELSVGDSLMITIKDVINGTQYLQKSFVDALTLTLAETAQVPVGKYVYSLDWYRGGAFMCNIIPKAPFKVVDKV